MSRPSVQRLLRTLMGVWMGLCVGMPVATSATHSVATQQVPDTMTQRLQACTACHGKEGRASNAGYLPRIAGKPAAYLYNQLINFRDGRRSNAAMANLLGQQTDAYLWDMAQHFASMDLPYPAPQPATAPESVLKRGLALVKQGNIATDLPACTSCHGDAMTGVLPAVPGLLGLPRDYLLGQLGAWKNGQRHAPEPDCMQQVVAKLSLDDISAVATWLAAQPLPANTHAQAKPAHAPKPTMRCGSGHDAVAQPKAQP